MKIYVPQYDYDYEGYSTAEVAFSSLEKAKEWWQKNNFEPVVGEWVFANGEWYIHMTHLTIVEVEYDPS